MGRSFGELLDQYELYARAKGFSNDQIALTRFVVGLFDRFLNSPDDVRDVTGDDFRRFVVDLRNRRARRSSGKEADRPLSGTTVNTYCRVVKACFAWLSAERIVPENPLALIPAPRKPRTIPKVYGEKEILAVSAAVTSVRDRAIYELFLDSGARLKELSAIKMGDIDIAEGTVKITGKGGKERFVYFNPPVAESIQAYVKESRHDAAKNDALFVTPAGSPLTSRGIQTMLYRLGEKARLKERLSPHKLRHTFATLSLKNGGNLEYIKKILGHSDIKTTSEAYLNVSDEDVKAAHMKFSPIAHLKISSSRQEFASTNEKKLADEQKNSGLRPNYQALYDKHLRDLSELTGELIADIDDGNLETPRYSKTIPNAAFPGVNLARVYHAQNKRLWPFLSQHLDNEFNDPPITKHIGQVAIDASLARLFGKKPVNKSLAEAVRNKMIMVSERGTFVGICDICRSYFDN